MVTVRPSLQSQNQRGQALPIVALMLVFLFGIAALAVDGSLNYRDRRVLRAASDAAALSGAGVLAQGNAAAAQNSAMIYAFFNLGLTLPGGPLYTCTGDAFNPGGSGADICVISFGGYIITVTTNYTPLNTSANPYPGPSNVSVDIVHQNPQSGFASLTGTTAVTVGAHSAATVQTSVKSFPFALATRYLNISGNGSVGTLGAAIIGECSKEGTGGFVSNSQNGGIYFNGGTEFDIGSSTDGALYQSAQALLMADGKTRSTCTGGASNQNQNRGWANLSDMVKFDPSDSNKYNWFFGFNSGPPNCNLSTSSAATCELTATGVGSNWEDNPCWTTPKASDVSLTPATYDAATGMTSSGTATPCASGDTHEGSFPDSLWPGFPAYPTPTSVIAANDPGNAIPAGTGGATTLGSGGQKTKNQVFTAYTAGSGADLYFQPGWYVFDGTAANVVLRSGSFNCVNQPAIGFLAGGCVFIFRNGASLDIQGNRSSLRCSPTAGAGYLGCAFEFHDSASAKATMALTNKVASVDLLPLTYTPAGSSTSARLPIIWSDDNQDCTGGSTPCAVELKQASSFNVGGTIFVPKGIYGAGANASGTSGQVVADTVLLQSGASALGSGITYKSSLLAPVPGSPFLFE